MHILLSIEQQQRLLEWAGTIARAHGDADCEPPGYELRIAIGASGARAEAVSGSARIALGEVEVALSG